MDKIVNITNPDTNSCDNHYCTDDRTPILKTYLIDDADICRLDLDNVATALSVKF